MTTDHRVEIQLLDRKFQIKCPRENQRGLHQAAHYLDQKMRKMSEGAPMVNTERIVVMAALNIVYDLLFAENRDQRLSEEIIKRIETLHERIDKVLLDTIHES